MNLLSQIHSDAETEFVRSTNNRKLPKLNLTNLIKLKLMLGIAIDELIRTHSDPVIRDNEMSAEHISKIKFSSRKNTKESELTNILGRQLDQIAEDNVISNIPVYECGELLDQIGDHWKGMYTNKIENGLIRIIAWLDYINLKHKENEGHTS